MTYEATATGRTREAAPLARRGLGRTGLEVTCLGLGGAPLGDFSAHIPTPRALATIEAAYDGGVRLYDTAPLYGHGLSEHRFGHELREKPRDEFVLSTKVGRLLSAEAPEKIDRGWFTGGLNFNVRYDYSYDGTMRSIEDSLARLCMNRIDVALIHDVDFWTHGSAELAERQGFSILLGGPYNSGILATGARPGAKYNYKPAPEPILERVARIEAVCARDGVPIATAAIQFPLGHPSVASVVPGAVHPSEVEQNLAMMRVPVPTALWGELKAEGLLAAEAPVPAEVTT